MAAVPVQQEIEGVWTTIKTLTMTSGETVTIGLNETEGKARNGRLYVAGYGNRQASDVSNRQGKEAITEGWMQAKLPADSSWVTLTFPTSFPASFLDLDSGEGAFPVVIGATGRTLVQIKLTIPGTPDTMGKMRVFLRLGCLDA